MAVTYNYGTGRRKSAVARVFIKKGSGNIVVNGKPVDPRKGLFPIDEAQTATSAANAAQRVEDYGKRATEAVQRVIERFDAQPRAIDQATQATRQLDDITKELGVISMLEHAILKINEGLVDPLQAEEVVGPLAEITTEPERLTLVA